MKAIILPAGTTTSEAEDAKVIADIKACVPEDVEWAIQLAMPDDLDYCDDANVQRRITVAKRDRDRIGVGVPWVLLNHEVPPDIKPLILQADDYATVAQAARLEFGPDRVVGAYQVPRVPKIGGVADAAAHAASLYLGGFRWACPSTYRRVAGKWRDITDCCLIAKMLGYRTVPYVSAQFEGDGAILPAMDVLKLRLTLEANDIDTVIIWANIALRAQAVEAIRLAAGIFHA